MTSTTNSPKPPTPAPAKKFEELQKFHEKLADLTFLDPACGAGNFLVITYRELRRLEHKVLAILDKGEQSIDWLASSEEHGRIKVNVDQMYGIEIEEFPSLIARTALWLTDHQMNMEFSHASGKTFKRLPLTASATIVHGNALTTDWAEVIAPSELNYILGNPPFVGSKMMTPQMRSELEAQFDGYKGVGVLDFVSAWYAKAATFMKQNPKVQTALVSTNSIIQGEQVPILWKYLFGQGVAINFLHQTFKWSNDAKGNAAVYCTIVGFALFSKPEKRIFEYADIKSEPNELPAKNINGYGIDAPSVFIERRSKPLCNVPPMSFGNMPLDGGNLLLSEEEKQELLAKEPQAEQYIKRLVGAKEFLQGGTRWCLWLKDADPSKLKQLPAVLERVEGVKNFRLSSSDAGTRRIAERPATFRDTQELNAFLLIPRHSSENRDYVPMGLFTNGEIPHDSCLIVGAATLYHLGILTSQMHMAWMRAVAGRLESRYRYSKDIVYNNFIWPEATAEQKAEIERLAQAVLDARTQFPQASLADLYDPLTMPPSLAKAHKTLDRAVDRLYRKEPFGSDTDRVVLLFKKYKEAS